MLTKFHKVLIGALVVQLALAAFVLTRGDATAVVKETPLLAGFDASKVTRVQVFALGPDGAAPKAASVDLAKKGDAWVVASGFDYPVDGAKVPDALAPIAKMAAAAPIATQAARFKQLKVADDDYERKLVITADGKDTVLYVGNAAGARRTAVRLGGDDRVFAVSGVSAFAIGDSPRTWVAGRYLEVPHDDIVKVTIAKDGHTTELFKAVPPPPAPAPGKGSGSGSGSAAPPAPASTEPQWTATFDGAPLAPAAGEIVDLAAIDRAVSSVSLIDLDAPADPKRDASKPTATITIERKATAPAAGSGSAAPAASTAPVVLDVILDGTNYWIKDRSSPRAVTIGKARLETVADPTPAKFVKKPDAAAPKRPTNDVPMDLPGLPMGD